MLGLKSPKSYMQTFNIFKIILFLIARGGGEYMHNRPVEA